MKPLPVALDAMGGDNGPEPNVAGAINAVLDDSVATILVGDQETLLECVKAHPRGHTALSSSLLNIHHADEVVEMDEKPAQAVRKKRQSSMRLSCDLVEAGEACAALSAGNSGAMMAMALRVFGRLDGVLRPCIGAIYPHPAGQGIIVDAGANIECTPEQLLQFGILGETFMREIYKLDSPRVGVLANGTEASKGNELTRAALELLSFTDVNLIGHVEGKNLPHGDIEVVVCDGFTGNVALKVMEGVGREVVTQLKKGYMEGGLLSKIGALLSVPVFKDIKKKLDYREFGAAPFLGLKHPAYIAHGSSDDYAIRQGLGTAARGASLGITEQLERALESQLAKVQQSKLANETKDDAA
ncbi:MAG: phosphate acyltransferase PlsX [Deltaproteobacteria bacterium]|nr:phosphate acyltransferase PlsX [Deltaproteobacteria bacterium]